MPESLEASTKEKRGKGIRRRAQPFTKLSKNWKDFLLLMKTSRNYSHFCPSKQVILSAIDGKEIYATQGASVVCSVAEGLPNHPVNCLIYPIFTYFHGCIHTSSSSLLLGCNSRSYGPCSHEEAHSRLFVHVADAFYKGHTKVAIRTVDTDVVVIEVAAFKVFCPQELWVAFGTGPNFRFIAVHKIVDAMGPKKSSVLPIFHALTGCDTVFGFSGIGKKT